MHDFEHVLKRERFEVEAIRRVVVGGHGLGIAIHHDRFVPGITQRHGSVHTRVVELDALTDAIRSAAEDDYGRLRARHDFGFLVVRRVVVRRACGEFGGTGVHRLVHRADPHAVTQFADLRFGYAAKLGDLGIGEAKPLRMPHIVGGQLRSSAKRVCFIVDEHKLLKEPWIDLRRRMDLLNRGTCPQRQLHFRQSAIARDAHALEECRDVDVGLLCGPLEDRLTLFDGAQCLLERFGE